MSPAVPPLLHATGLSYAYQGTPVFAGVDIAIGRREIVCLIGASGCGKSTLLRVLAGLSASPTGEVRIAEPERGSPASRAGVVFQSPALLPWLNVRENAAFGLDFACRPATALADAAAQVARALGQVGLAQHADKRPNQLSGGQAQRVALARALARAPDIIYLDEPFSALDAVTRESMQDLLVELAHEQEAAALLVTHDIDEALRVADRVLLLAPPAPGEPATLVGEWRPDGRAPRQHRSQALNALREEILNTLSQPALAWYPAL